ncbi:hypothetical protein DFH07DRAFT_791379 [Mycena maculata]|uniref:Uncharacterized protein n=1 Tax=Mycena maculata TaxID=230809 RepID=A0AAD7KB51_9AGAR|nr:hypothetical protein DFH07DRAFT_791379 [Mycena maculata]
MRYVLLLNVGQTGDLVSHTRRSRTKCSVMSPLMTMLFFLFPLILAAPLGTREVYAPPITKPTADSVWTVGAVETVTWNASGIPPGVTGMIQLGYLTPDSEHLSLILASGFNLTDEEVNITVPAVVSRTNYIIVLFGDSGNASPEFTIQGLTSASGSGTATSTTPTSVGTLSTAAAPSKTGNVVSVTPSPPIATASSSGLTSAPTGPSSTATAPSSGSTSSSGSPSSPGSTSSSLPTSSGASPSPSPSNNARWSMDKLNVFQVMMAPLTIMLVL